MEIMVRFDDEQTLVVQTAARMKGLKPGPYARAAAFLWAKQELKELSKVMSDEKLVARVIETLKLKKEETETNIEGVA